MILSMDFISARFARTLIISLRYQASPRMLSFGLGFAGRNVSYLFKELRRNDLSFQCSFCLFCTNGMRRLQHPWQSSHLQLLILIFQLARMFAMLSMVQNISLHLTSLPLFMDMVIRAATPRIGRSIAWRRVCLIAAEAVFSPKAGMANS